MMKYFIRTDNLKETLPLYAWFVNNPKRILPAETMAELGGYLLDKRLEEVRGVPNEYVEQIEGIRDLLLNAVKSNPALPEPHYHLARYYQSLGNIHEERVTLEVAIRAFDAAGEESVRRRMYRIDAHLRYANNLINSREFTPAEEQLVRGINLYEDALSRRLISRSPDYGRLYAGMGDLEYFTKTGDMETALNYYHRSEQNGWSPPEMQYRMGAAYYQLEDWKTALEYLFTASSGLPLNRRLLFALGNAALKRGDYFAAQGYYNRLLDILETQRARLPVLLPNDRPEYLELAERLMMARNNAGVASEALADQTGDRRYRVRAQALYAEADRAWDARTRDPRTMIRSGGIPLPYLNSRNTLYPQSEYEPQIFIRIDRDVLEPSRWEELAPVAAPLAAPLAAPMAGLE
jgi:tetratricopeptide (TPR) repeat protein